MSGASRLTKLLRKTGMPDDAITKLVLETSEDGLKKIYSCAAKKMPAEMLMYLCNHTYLLDDYTDDVLRMLADSSYLPGVVYGMLEKYGDDFYRVYQRYGDDAIEVLSKHGDELFGLPESYRHEAIDLVMSYGDEVLEGIRKYGDDFMIRYANEGETFIQEYLEKGDEVFENATKPDAGSGSEGGLKSGKDLIKNISKIEYGTDELSKVAIEFRKANNITSARRNVCVVEYKNADGTIVQKAFASNASNHSEELMIDFLKADNISGEDVIKIFTEREPCVETATNVGHNCTNRIIEYTPDAEVTYAVDYGVTQEDGLNARNILQELLQNLLN